ncbi:tryptophan--tRNA ligase [Dictyocaulus viviparus]|uniref:tryptophan--tRNA ligase n=1 Tax=Dictyocaulus viviparus TaxID=29172 RepID=A0A0D8Y8I3_DICVI|nr:tryptophan--tRNA ligase [Dictyocaulus viviparus]
MLGSSEAMNRPTGQEIDPTVPSLPPSTKMILAIADQHAISLGPIPSKELRDNVRRMAVSLLACGVDPNRTLLFRQSSVPQIAQLSWILGSLQTVSRLQRLTQYKEKASKFSHRNIPLGLLIYPVLQAADVLMFKATHVPVGADQAQHMNLLVDIAENFNMRYQSSYFPLPIQVTRPVLSRVRSLRNPTKKMSKSEASGKSRIEINDSPDEIEEKCRKAISDNDAKLSYNFEMRPGVSNLIDIYCAITETKISSVVEGGWNQLELKMQLCKAIEKKFCPIRDKLIKLEQSSEADDILSDGDKKARSIAQKNLDEIQSIVGFS